MKNYDIEKIRHYSATIIYCAKEHALLKFSKFESMEAHTKTENNRPETKNDKHLLKKRISVTSESKDKTTSLKLSKSKSILLTVDSMNGNSNFHVLKAKELFLKFYLLCFFHFYQTTLP